MRVDREFGMKQVELARKYGVTQGNVSIVLSGRTWPEKHRPLVKSDTSRGVDPARRTKRVQCALCRRLSRSFPYRRPSACHTPLSRLPRLWGIWHDAPEKPSPVCPRCKRKLRALGKQINVRPTSRHQQYLLHKEAKDAAREALRNRWRCPTCAQTGRTVQLRDGRMHCLACEEEGRGQVLWTST